MGRYILLGCLIGILLSMGVVVASLMLQAAPVSDSQYAVVVVGGICMVLTAYNTWRSWHRRRQR